MQTCSYFKTRQHAATLFVILLTTRITPATAKSIEQSFKVFIWSSLVTVQPLPSCLVLFSCVGDVKLCTNETGQYK